VPVEVNDAQISVGAVANDMACVGVITEPAAPLALPDNTPEPPAVVPKLNTTVVEPAEAGVRTKAFGRYATGLVGDASMVQTLTLVPEAKTATSSRKLRTVLIAPIRLPVMGPVE